MFQILEKKKTITVNVEIFFIIQKRKSAQGFYVCYHPCQIMCCSLWEAKLCEIKSHAYLVAYMLNISNLSMGILPNEFNMT